MKRKDLAKHEAADRDSSDFYTKDPNYPEIYKGFYIHLQSNNKLEGYRKNRSFVKNTWQELKKKIDEFWRMKELSPEEVVRAEAII